MSNNPILLKENSKLMNEYNFKKNTEFNLDTLTLGSNKKIWWIWICVNFLDTFFRTILFDRI